MSNCRVVAGNPEVRMGGEDPDVRHRRLQNKTLQKQGKTKQHNEIA
jgi:hypothetical protein